MLLSSQTLIPPHLAISGYKLKKYFTICQESMTFYRKQLYSLLNYAFTGFKAGTAGTKTAIKFTSRLKRGKKSEVKLSL
jgi:hypothetical protein